MASQALAACAPPAACSIYDADAASACVMWSPSAGAASYAVEMRGAGDEAWTTLSTTLKACKCRKKGLDASRAYEFRVAAVDAAGAVGEFSGIAKVASRADVAQQPAPVVSAVDGESVTVQWSGGEGPYALQFAAEEDLRADATTPWRLAAASVNGTVAKKKNLDGGKRYAFRVKPADAAGYEWSRASETALIPRAAPFMARCFGTDLVNKSGGKRTTGPSLAGKIVAVYASANWWPPCRNFSPNLVRDYNVLKAAGRPFEVVWLSCERDPEAFSSTFAQFPFLAVPFDNDERERALGNFKVSGIPRLVILGPDGRELVNNAVGMSLSIATVDGWMRQAKGHK